MKVICLFTMLLFTVPGYAWECPEHLNTKQDYLNIIKMYKNGDQRVSKKRVEQALKRLKDSQYEMIPAWPDGYDPETSGPEVKPAWKKKKADNGKMFKLKFTAEEINKKIEELECKGE